MYSKGPYTKYVTSKHHHVYTKNVMPQSCSMLRGIPTQLILKIGCGKKLWRPKLCKRNEKVIVGAFFVIVKTPRTFVSISTTSPTLMVVRDQGCGGQLERVRRYCVLVMSLPGPGLYWPSSSQTFSQGQETTPWRDQHLHLRLNSQH